MAKYIIKVLVACYLKVHNISFLTDNILYEKLISISMMHARLLETISLLKKYL